MDNDLSSQVVQLIFSSYNCSPGKKVTGIVFHLTHLTILIFSFLDVLFWSYISCYVQKLLATLSHIFSKITKYPEDAMITDEIMTSELRSAADITPLDHFIANEVSKVPGAISSAISVMKLRIRYANTDNSLIKDLLQKARDKDLCHLEILERFKTSNPSTVPVMNAMCFSAEFEIQKVHAFYHFFVLFYSQ